MFYFIFKGIYKWDINEFHNLFVYSLLLLLFLVVLIGEIFSHLIDGSESVRNLVLYFLVQLCIGFIVTLWLENWIPSKVSAASWFNYFSWSSSDKKKRFLQLWTHVGDNTLSITCLIFKWLNHFCKSLRAYIF